MLRNPTAPKFKAFDYSSELMWVLQGSVQELLTKWYLAYTFNGEILKHRNLVSFSYRRHKHACGLLLNPGAKRESPSVAVSIL
jgi:hypothetical protein